MKVTSLVINGKPIDTSKVSAKTAEALDAIGLFNPSSDTFKGGVKYLDTIFPPTTRDDNSTISYIIMNGDAGKKTVRIGKLGDVRKLKVISDTDTLTSEYLQARGGNNPAGAPVIDAL
jgi:hypothetical protein